VGLGVSSTIVSKVPTVGEVPENTGCIYIGDGNPTGANFYKHDGNTQGTAATSTGNVNVEYGTYKWVSTLGSNSAGGWRLQQAQP
jgi:hypothetical protein